MIKNKISAMVVALFLVGCITDGGSIGLKEIKDDSTKVDLSGNITWDDIKSSEPIEQFNGMIIRNSHLSYYQTGFNTRGIVLLDKDSKTVGRLVGMNSSELSELKQASDWSSPITVRPIFYKPDGSEYYAKKNNSEQIFQVTLKPSTESNSAEIPENADDLKLYSATSFINEHTNKKDSEDSNNFFTQEYTQFGLFKVYRDIQDISKDKNKFDILNDKNKLQTINLITGPFKVVPHFYTFIRTKQANVEVPVSITATYHGKWNYVDSYRTTSADDSFYKSKTNKDNTTTGSSVGYNQTGFDKQLANSNKNLVGTVDFQEKKVLLKLNYNSVSLQDGKYIAGQEKTIFTINGSINGDKFSGKATADDPDNGIFNKGSDNVTGGFFGPKSQELAGFFTTTKEPAATPIETKTLGNIEQVVVFAGKRNTDNDANVEFKAIPVLETSAIKSTITSDNTPTNFKTIKFEDLNINLAQAPTNTSGKKPKGYQIPDTNDTLYSCCGNIKYLTVGAIYQGVEKDSTIVENGVVLFTSGYVTPETEVPQSGTAIYAGNWIAYAKESTNKIHDTVRGNNFSGFAGDSRFNVNFADKKIIGQLTIPGGVDLSEAINPNDSNNRFYLDGNITGNAISGRVTMTGGLINSDVDNSNHGGSISKQQISDFNGKFYGPNATELGGHFTSTNGMTGDAKQSMIGVVFTGIQKQKSQ